jgi:C-8 sterol isomerase
MGCIFNPERLGEIARVGEGLPFEEMSRAVVEAAAAAYPGHVETRQEWIFNLAGGATGMMNVLHGSITEYLIIFGSSIGTNAFSGRYPMEIHDWVMSGAMHTYTQADPGHAVTTAVGDHARLDRATVKGFSIEPDTWMLEYGRGFVPGGLHTTLVDVLMRGLDPWILAQTMKVYGRITLRELLLGKI